MGMTITSTLAQQLNSAIGAHGLWKTRLRQAIDSGSSEFAVDKVGKDNLCDFGKWLHTGCDPAAKASSHHATIEQLHAEFHKVAAEVLKLATSGKKAEADKMFQGMFATKSMDLVMALQSWKSS